MQVLRKGKKLRRIKMTKTRIFSDFSPLVKIRLVKVVRK